MVILQFFDAYACSIRPSEYTWRILRLSAAAWLIAFAVLLLGQGELTRESILTSWLYAINTRSLGAEVVPAAPLARPIWWLLAILMLVSHGSLKRQSGGSVGSETAYLASSLTWAAG